MTVNRSATEDENVHGPAGDWRLPVVGNEVGPQAGPWEIPSMFRKVMMPRPALPPPLRKASGFPFVA